MGTKFFAPESLLNTAYHLFEYTTMLYNNINIDLTHIYDKLLAFRNAYTLFNNKALYRMRT